VREPQDLAGGLDLAGTDDPLIPTANAALMSHLLARPTVHLYHDGHLGLVQATHLAPVFARFLRALSRNEPFS
jgi:hypothetical protein